MNVTIRADEGDFLTIDVTRREHVGATDYWDGNWLSCQITIKAGHFRGSFPASLRVEEFAHMRDGVAKCARDAKGTFEFETMEHQLSILGTSDQLGRFEANGVAEDRAGIGNELKFRLAFDQTRLPSLLTELDALLEAYPIIGKP